MEVKIKKLHPDAVIPKYATELASGFDLVAVEDKIIDPGQQVLISTGLAFAIPVGYELQIRPRSGLSYKTKLRISNSPGTVDADYRGEVKILLENTSQVTVFEDYAQTDWEDVDTSPLDEGLDIVYHILKGDRIAQGVICPIVQAELVVVDELDETERGSGGFGHTGVN